MAVWALCKISTKNWQWTASTGVAVVVLLSFVCVCVAVALPKFKKLQSLTDNLNRVTRENLTGLNVVRAYNAEGYQQKKFNEAKPTAVPTPLPATKKVVWPTWSKKRSARLPNPAAQRLSSLIARPAPN